MDPTETSSNPDHAAGESAATADLTATDPETPPEPMGTVTDTGTGPETEIDPQEPALPPTMAEQASIATSTTSAGHADATQSDVEPQGPAPNAEAGDSAEVNPTVIAQPGDPAGEAGSPVNAANPQPADTAEPLDPGHATEADSAGGETTPAPDAAARPARIISSAGAPGGPAAPASKAPEQGTIPPPPGPGSAVTANPAPPSLGEIRGLRSGQIIEGRVTVVDANEAVLEMDDGSVGVIGKRHLTANGQTAPTELLSVGDRVEAAVLVRDDPKGRLVLSRAWALKQRAWGIVEAAKAANKPLTGRVTGLVKGGLVVDVGTRAFLPASQIDLQHVDDLASFVGQDIEALVHEADRINDKVVLSRRNLLRQAQRAKANEVVSTLAPGQVHKGRVSLLTDFGAFVEIGGVRGLVHLSEISWSRVDRAADVLSPGDEVDVKVLAIKPGKKLSLSIRALSPDPLAGLETGQVLSGVVSRLADFGAFVRVGEGAEGLVHVTELAEYRVHAPEEVVTPGDEVLVKVLRIDRKRRRLDLSVNQAVLS